MALKAQEQSCSSARSHLWTASPLVPPGHTFPGGFRSILISRWRRGISPYSQPVSRILPASPWSSPAVVWRAGHFAPDSYLRQLSKGSSQITIITDSVHKAGSVILVFQDKNMHKKREKANHHHRDLLNWVSRCHQGTVRRGGSARRRTPGCKSREATSPVPRPGRSTSLNSSSCIFNPSIPDRRSSKAARYVP